MTAAAAMKSTAVGGMKNAGMAAWVLGLVVVLSIFGPYLAIKSQSASGEGSVVRQLLYIGAFVASVMATRGHVLPMRLMVVPVPLVIALGWCLLSLGWSLAPGIGLRRLILTATIIWTIFVAVENAGYERSMVVLAKVLIATLVLNYLACLLVPRIGIHMQGDNGDLSVLGAWRGIFLHKNFAGPVAAFTILFFALGRPNMRWTWRTAIVLASAFFLYKSMSKTSLALAALCLLLGWAFRYYRPRYGPLIGMMLIFCVALGLMLSWSAFPGLVDAMQRPDALTGRGQIWPVLLSYASDHLLTGSGYGSFWNIGENSPIFDYAQGWVSTTVAQGHNGYIDILVGIGVPGLLILVFATVLVPLGKLLGARRIPRERGGMLFAMMIFVVGHNLTESSLFDRDLTVQVLWMTTMALIYAASRGEPQPRVVSSAPAAQAQVEG